MPGAVSSIAFSSGSMSNSAMPASGPEMIALRDAPASACAGRVSAVTGLSV